SSSRSSPRRATRGPSRTRPPTPRRGTATRWTWRARRSARPSPACRAPREPAVGSRRPGGGMTKDRLELSLMVEGQEGLTWDRWRRLADAAEAGGFAGLYRSDHLTGLFGHPTRPSLETWASLAWLATATRRVRFGPIVCPMTFYQPALLAKR